MNNKAQFVIEFSLHEGKQESFKDQMREIIPFVQSNEPGALIYEFYFNNDETKCYVMEQYADSSALLTHLTNVDSRLKEILTISSITRLEFFGELSPEARAVAESFGATFFTHFGGFSRS